jgi:NitT/TauT family transport system ATP-binding protein
MAGLEGPTSGQVRFEGRTVIGAEEKVSMVFQSFALFPWRTVLENAEYGLETHGMPRDKRREIEIAVAS